MIAAPARSTVAPPINKNALDEWMSGLLNRHPAVGFAAGVVREGRLAYFLGHGMADVASQTPITERTIFRIASITKTFTAIAVMQLSEQGLVDIDAAVNRYLRGFRLVPKRPDHREPTLRDLLTHTSGIPEMVRPSRALRYIYGESYGLADTVPSLPDYYRGALKLVSEPGAVFRYTDHNFAVVGQVVEDVSGERLDRYLRARVFEPLGMTDSELVRSDAVKARLATGYVLGRRGPRPVTDRQWLTAAASMAYSSPRDMARYVAALIGGGANEHGAVLKSETMDLMFAAQYRPDPRIPGLGLAFDRAQIGAQVAIGHEGVLPGFNSQIFASPGSGLGVMAFTNGARGAMLWLPYEMATLLGRLVGAPADGIRSDIPKRPDVWSDVCGWYPLEAPITDMRMRAMLGAGARVSVRHGELFLRVYSPVPAVLRGFVLHPDDPRDPYVFRIDASQFGMGTGRVVFSHDRGVTRAHLDLLPITLQRRAPRGDRAKVRTTP